MHSITNAKFEKIKVARFECDTPCDLDCTYYLEYYFSLGVPPSNSKLSLSRIGFIVFLRLS